MNDSYLVLCHSPIINKKGDMITTSVTNLDIHDIARTARTFGFKKYLIITPIELQKALVQRILDHWSEEKASAYNPDRFDALSFIKVVPTLEAASELIESETGKKPLVTVTGANFKQYEGKEPKLREVLSETGKPLMLIFGTGWGLYPTVVESADFRLEPLFGAAKDGYNHLSVRSAVAIYADRLFGNA